MDIDENGGLNQKIIPHSQVDHSLDLCQQFNDKSSNSKIVRPGVNQMTDTIQQIYSVNILGLMGTPD